MINRVTCINESKCVDSCKPFLFGPSFSNLKETDALFKTERHVFFSFLQER